MARIRHFRELEVYQEGFALAMELFRRSAAFPRTEGYQLTSQLRRSSRSVCANIAEAWRKRRYPAAFVAKLSDAEAEAAETSVWLEIASACGYLDSVEFSQLDRRYDRLIARLVRMIQTADQWMVGTRTPASRTQAAAAGQGERRKDSPPRPTPTSPRSAVVARNEERRRNAPARDAPTSPDGPAKGPPR